LRTIARILRFAVPYWPWFLVAQVSVFLSAGLILVVPRLLRDAIDRAILGGNPRLLLAVALGVIGVAVLRGLFLFTQRYAMEWVAQKSIYDLRNALYRHLQHLSFSFYDQARTGQLMSRAMQDVETVRRLFSFGVHNLLRNFLQYAGIVVILLLTHWKLALLSMATVPLAVHAIGIFGRRIRPAFTEIQQELAELTNVLQENITGVRVVKAFAREDHEIEKFRATNWTLLEKNLVAQRLMAFYHPYMDFLAAVGTALILWYGGREVILGRMSLGTLVAFNAYLMLLLEPMRWIGMLVSLVSRAIASGQRVLEILDTRPEIEDAPDAIELKSVQGHVRLEDVWFSYPDEPDVPVLKGITIDAPPGRTIALLGATGSGKSTVIHLVPRFYDVTRGRVTVDGIDVRRVKLESLRSHIGIVLQETFLFSTTIRENIAYGRPRATDEEIVAAARAARIHDFIMSLPQGYDTVVGERGVGLSGGQKQRVAIARALLMDPRVLILDDSTSSVDTETEYLIQEALRALMKGRTTFVIAQRLSTVKNADEIVVLDQGEVVQRGRHEDLLAQPGIYREIFELQLKPQEVSEAEAEARAESEAARERGRQPVATGGRQAVRPVAGGAADRSEAPEGRDG